MALPPIIEPHKKSKMNVAVSEDILKRQKRIDDFAVLHKLTLNCDPHFANAISKVQDKIERELSELDGVHYALDERLQKRAKKPETVD